MICPPKFCSRPLIVPETLSEPEKSFVLPPKSFANSPRSLIEVEMSARKLGLIQSEDFDGQRIFATERELIIALLDVELFDFDLAIVERCAEHHRLGKSIAPNKIAHFRPNRSGGMSEILGVAVESKFASAHCAAGRFAQIERRRHLGKRYG